MLPTPAMTPAMTPVTSYSRLDAAGVEADALANAGDDDVAEVVWERSVKITFPKQLVQPVTEAFLAAKIASFGGVVEIGVKDKLALVLFARSAQALHFACNHGGVLGEDFKVKFTGSKPVPAPGTLFPVAPVASTASAAAAKAPDSNMGTGAGSSDDSSAPQPQLQPTPWSQGTTKSVTAAAAAAVTASLSKAEKASAALRQAADLAASARSSASAMSVDLDLDPDGDAGVQVRRQWWLVVHSGGSKRWFL